MTHSLSNAPSPRQSPTAMSPALGASTPALTQRTPTGADACAAAVNALPPVAHTSGNPLGAFYSSGVFDAAAPTVSQFRHKWEMRMIGIAFAATFIALAAAVVIILQGGTPDEWAMAALVGLAGPVVAFVWAIRHNYWKHITNGVEVTSQQFPELYQTYHDLAIEMGFTDDGEGLQKTPRLFVYNGNGALNAFASKCQLHKGYVVLYSDLVDVAYTHGDFGFLRFVLAHELGHIKCGHVSMWRIIPSGLTTLIRLAPSVTRAQEYTADRVALYYAGDCADSMIALSAGKNLAKRVNMDEYYANISTHKDGLWMRIVNFLADHAIGFRRMQAIADAKKHGWNVHGKML